MKEIYTDVFLAVYDGKPCNIHTAMKQTKIIVDCLMTGIVPSDDEIVKELQADDEFRLYQA